MSCRNQNLSCRNNNQYSTKTGTVNVMILAETAYANNSWIAKAQPELSLLNFAEKQTDSPNVDL